MPERPLDFRSFIAHEHESVLASYRARPDNIRENHGQEQTVVQGGYGRKQLQELVQNAIDALGAQPGDIHVVLTDECLYVANQGRPFDRAGITSLLHSNMSDKRDDQIGRFGLGFKSVLQVSDRPQVFSDGVAFGFDAARSRATLSAIAPGLTGYPVLRLPFLLDSAAERASDPVLMELSREFITIVRLPLIGNRASVLQQISDFPGEVLLFSPSLRRLHIEVRGSDPVDLVWSSESTDKSLPPGIRAVTLTHNDTPQDWLVASMDYIPTLRAQEDAGTLHARIQTRVTWAVPRMSGLQRTRGRAWNFFPTKTEFTLGGIVNAAFKMNDDRVTILETEYNKDIFSKAVPRLVAALLPLLSTPEDPAAHFNLMPARGREDDAWIRDVLITPVNQLLAAIPAVPDQHGVLQKMSDLKVRPALPADEEAEIPRAWTTAAREIGVADWAHEAAVRHRDRRALVDRLQETVHGRRATEQEWLEGLTAPRTTASFAAAIRFAHHWHERRLGPTTLGDLSPIRSARIIPRRDGSVSDIQSGITLQAAPTQSDTGVVDPRLEREPGVLAALKSWGAKRLEGVNLLAEVLSSLATHAAPDPEDVLAFWQIAEEQAGRDGAASADAVLRIIRAAVQKHGSVPVVTASGEVHGLAEVWAPGRLLDVESPADRAISLKTGHPYLRPPLLSRLGVPSDLAAQDQVRFDQAPPAWQSEIQALCQDQARRASGGSARAGKAIRILGGGRVGLTPGLDALTEVSPRTRARITERLLDRELTIEIEFDVQVRDSAGHFTLQETLTVPTPDGLWVSKHGVMHTAFGWTPVGHCVILATDDPMALHPDLLPVPVAKNSTGREIEWAVLGAQTGMRGIDWNAVLDHGARSVQSGEFELESLHALYGNLAIQGVRPPRYLYTERDAGHRESLPAVDALVPMDELTNEHLLTTKSPVGRVFPTSPALRDALVERWKLRPLAISFRQETIVTEDIAKDSQALLERFPYLSRGEGKLTKLKGYTLIPSTKLGVRTSNDFDDFVIDDESRALLVADNERAIYFRSTLRDQGILARLLVHVGSSRDVEAVQTRMVEAHADALKHNLWRALKGMSSDKERVVHLLRDGRLRQLIPDAALELLEGESAIEVGDDILYRMAQNVHGTNLWSAMTSTMEATEATEAWLKEIDNKDVEELGFSADFVSRGAPKPPPREEVMGPITLNRLHAYQESTAARVCTMLAAEPGQNKGLMQLPTGAGKTRVAVESLIRNVERLHQAQQHRHLIVWIAQTEELCEQAVAAWSSAWRAIGIANKQMVVSRFWASRNVNPEDAHLQVVVTTYQTLRGVAAATEESARRVRYEWLSDPDVVVIDEAHGATASSYTTILKWMGRSTGQKGKALLGLSATPYRGHSEQATLALVRRFGEKLIEPSDHFTAENAHDYLQQERVLARVRQASLEGTMLQRLSPGRAAVKEDAEGDNGRHAALERLIDLDSVGNDRERNSSIIRDIADRIESEGLEHVIVFAASVAHAQALASVLDVKGINAAAIHSGTDAARRRSLVESFTRGDLQVLTNFDVLSQGFDAPKVDAVYLCRPTFSPNKYIQMIGRGLRGPRNGGSEEVLIVNIDDNLENFGTSLAFTEFAYLWGKSLAEDKVTEAESS